MKLSDIIATIEKTAPLSFMAPWDKSGIQVATFRDRIGHIAVMLDPTPTAIEAALVTGADFLLSHHPLSMQPRFPDKNDQYFACLSLLLKHDVCLYSAHTSLDGNPEGPACWLAKRLGLSNVNILEEGAAQVNHGFGFVGTLPAPLLYDEFCYKLGHILNKQQWHTCGPKPQKVSKVACCPGSGSSLLGDVINSRADIFITGDIKYHTAIDTAVRIIDVGHFCIEEEMMRLFASQLQHELSTTVTFIQSSDPLTLETLC